MVVVACGRLVPDGKVEKYEQVQNNRLLVLRVGFKETNKYTGTLF